MKWMSQQFVLPVLLGVSLTGVSVAFIYLLYQKNEDESRRKTQVETSRQNVMQCKVPRQFVPAVIGRFGATIKDIQNKTGTHVCFNEDNIECPDRICMIKGSLEGTRLAEEMIKNIIENQPIIETYEMYVPQKICGALIGKGGQVIKKIQADSSAKILIEAGGWSSDPDTQRRVIIKGTAEQIATALSQITDKVQKEKEALLKEVAPSLRLPRGKLSPRNMAVHTSESMQPAKPPPLQDIDGSMEVFVSAMKNPNQFWIQIVDSKNTALDKLVKEMTAYYNENESRELHVLKNITPGQMVASRFSFDEQWYRGEVISAPVDGYCEIYYVDYGDYDTISVDFVLELRTDFVSLRLQAIECSLANVKPQGSNEWSDEACERFMELTWVAQWKVLVAKVRRYKTRAAVSDGRSRTEGSMIPCMDLYDKNDNQNINIAEELINEGFAEPEEASLSAASSTLSLSRRSPDFSTISSPASASPLAKRARSPHTPENTPNRLDSSLEMPKTTTVRPGIDEIDLTTPVRSVSKVEEVDLVTPVKNETSRFIDNEKKVHRENGSGDYLRNGNTNQYDKPRNFKIARSTRVAPAGYESDLSGDSDEFELG